MNPYDIKAIFTSYVSLPEGNPSKGEDSKQVISFREIQPSYHEDSKGAAQKAGFHTNRHGNSAEFCYISIYFDIFWYPFPHPCLLWHGLWSPPSWTVSGKCSWGRRTHWAIPWWPRAVAKQGAWWSSPAPVHGYVARKWLAILILKPTRAIKAVPLGG